MHLVQAVYIGYMVPLPWCMKVGYGVRYAVSVLVIRSLWSDLFTQSALQWTRSTQNVGLRQIQLIWNEKRPS